MNEQNIDGNIAKVHRTSEEEKLYENQRLIKCDSIESVVLNEKLAVVGGTAWAFPIKQYKTNSTIYLSMKQGK